LASRFPVATAVPHDLHQPVDLGDRQAAIEDVGDPGVARLGRA
jgi:hypothetical protein